MTSGGIAISGACTEETCNVAWMPPSTMITAAHSSTKSTAGRSTLQPGPSSAHCKRPAKVPPSRDCGRGASRASLPVSGSVVDVCWVMRGWSMI